MYQLYNNNESLSNQRASKSSDQPKQLSTSSFRDRVVEESKNNNEVVELASVKTSSIRSTTASRTAALNAIERFTENLEEMFCINVRFL
jgi:hypothetical protein